MDFQDLVRAAHVTLAAEPYTRDTAIGRKLAEAILAKMVTRQLEDLKAKLGTEVRHA